METHQRSILKALSWRLWATLVTMAATLGLSGRWELAMAVGSVDVVAKLALYYLHERLWAGLSFGKKPAQERLYRVGVEG